MTRTQRIPALVLLAALGACNASTTLQSRAEPPHVLAFKPGDEVKRLDEALSIVFDREMVGVDEVGPVLEHPPVAIAPSTPLRVYWQDRKTLMVQPETEWRAGQRYDLQLRAPLTDHLAQPHGFQFDAQPLHLSSSLSNHNESTTPEFELTFSLQVDLTQVQTLCALFDAKGQRIGLQVKPRTDKSNAPSWPTRTVTPLQLETHYLLNCPGLTPFPGGAPLRSDPAADSFSTHGLLKLAEHWPATGKTAALAPEYSRLCLRFSTPVDTEELAAHVHVNPPPDGLADDWFEGPCEPELEQTEAMEGDRANSVLFAARGRFHVLVDAALTDHFGQALGHTEQWDFDTADRVPGLWTSTGAGLVLELGRAGHAVGTLNLNAVQLACLPLTAAQFANKFTGLVAWTNGEPDQDEPAATPWKLLNSTPRQQLMAASSPANVARTLPIDLASQCAGAQGSQHGGLYALELIPNAPTLQSVGRQGDQPARMLANVTDLSVIAKRGANSALVWVTRLSNGELVPHAEIEILNGQGQRIAKAQSDERGLARLPNLPEPSDDEVFSVRVGDDLAVVASDSRWSEGLRSWQLGAREGDDNAIQMFVHTDRGVYRPGERVYVHGLVRAVRDGSPARVPEQRDVALQLGDGSDIVWKEALQLSDFGSFASEIALPKQIAPGTYSLQVTSAAGRAESYPIQVAEFKPLTFEVTGAVRRSELLAGETVQLDVAASYLFGAPLSDAQLHYTVERSSGELHPPELSAFNFADSAPALPDETPWPVASLGVFSEQDDTADAQGRAQLQFDTEVTQTPLRYLITVSAADAAYDRATHSFSVLAHSADRYPGTHLSRFVYGAAESVQAEVVVVDRAGKRIAGEADAELRHVRWDCADPLQGCHATVEVLEQQHVSVNADKAALITFSAKAPGSVYVRVTTRDAGGRLARASDSGYVWSTQISGPYEDRIAAPLEVDRRSYRIGDEARLALQTPLAPAHFLVTAERSDLLSAQVVDRSSALPTLALGPEAAPNVFASMIGMTPRAADGEAGRPRLVAGMHEVSVSGPSRVLAARIRLQRDHYEPHQRVEGTVEVTHLGKPVLAEVALVAVNESVLQLTGFATPDPTQVFQAPRGLRVRTFSNVTLVVADPASAALVPETAHIGTAGEDSTGGKPELRNDYVAAAYVAPALRTDHNGRVKFSFDAPTDLSAYRLMAVVAAKDDRVGSTDSRMTVSQPLAAHVVAPRFASRGDVFQIGALVHDTTAKPGATDVKFSATGITLSQSSAQLNATPAGELARTQGTVQNVDHASFEVEVHKGPNADRVRHELNVRRPLDTELRVLGLGRDAKTRVPLAWPKGIDPDLSRLEVTIDRAGLAPLAPLLAMVMDYPYGCTEQTAAALSAIAAAPELARAIAPQLAAKADIESRIEDGLARLRAARSDDGKFGLYPGMAGRMWLTALVLEAGLAVRAAGFSVPAALSGDIARLLSDWLVQQDLRKQAPDDLEHIAQITWLLSQAGSVPKPTLDLLFALRSKLSTDGLAYTLQAAVLDQRPEAFRAALRRPLMAADWLTRERDPDEPLTSAERTTALALSALQRDGSAPEVCTKLAAWLSARAADPDHYWSTRDVAETLHALATWASGAQVGASHVRVGLGERVLWQGDLHGAQVVSLHESARTATAGDVWMEGNGKLSFSIRRRDVSESAPKPAFAHGLSLERRYLQPHTDKPLTSVKLGDIIQVEIELRSERPLRMLALTDPLPAGLEPLDPGLSNGNYAGCDECNSDSAFAYMRMHDDGIEAFAEWMPAGTHVLRYLLRATTQGSFSAPGASATLMYMPEVFARSHVDQLRVEPKDPRP